jgi:hypothetical protein
MWSVFSQPESRTLWFIEFHLLRSRRGEFIFTELSLAISDRVCYRVTSHGLLYQRRTFCSRRCAGRSRWCGVLFRESMYLPITPPKNDLSFLSRSLVWEWLLTVFRDKKLG